MRLIASVAVALALVVAACGKGGAEESDTGSGSEAAVKTGPGATADTITLGYLPDHLDEIPRDRPIVVHCAMGGRSSIAASILKSKGFENVINLAGGIGDWIKEGMPTVEEHQKLKT